MSSRDREGRAQKLVAIIRGSRSEYIINVLNRNALSKGLEVVEVSLDMALPNATLVIDRFHVVRLVMDAMQHARIVQRWKEIDKENEAIQRARSKGTRYKPLILSNGDTPKQLLARSRYLLYKLPSQWTQSQLHRVALLFQLYPIIEKAHRLAWDFRSIYNSHSKEKAILQFQDWIRQAKDVGIDHFNTASEAVLNHFEGILALFNNRSTNAHA